MNKTKVLTVLLALMFVPVGVCADFREYQDRFEFGLSAGVGFYVGQKNPSLNSNLVRVQSYDILAFGDRVKAVEWPGIETFGFNVGYAFDTRWKILAKTVRQRLSFVEYDDKNSMHGTYYNSMWHVDVMAEYNLLRYGDIMLPDQRIYNVVPYVGLGIGCTMYNQNATLRCAHGPSYNEKEINTPYPQVGKDYQGKDAGGKKVVAPNEIGVGLYIPMALGVKWRLSENVQLVGSFQYQLYFSNKTKGGLNSNLEGATAADYFAKASATGQEAIGRQSFSSANRPSFEKLNKQIVGYNHDCLFSLSIVLNMNRIYAGMRYVE